MGVNGMLTAGKGLLANGGLQGRLQFLAGGGLPPWTKYKF